MHLRLAGRPRALAACLVPPFTPHWGLVADQLSLRSDRSGTLASWRKPATST